MDNTRILTLLNNKKITISQILAEIKSMVSLFQNDRECFYVNEFCETAANRKKNPTEKEINNKSYEIYDNIQLDTKEFVGSYVESTTDFVLDCINDNLVPIEPAHALLIILATTKEVFAGKIE